MVMKTKENTIEPKERILHAAVSLFACHGFAGTGMRELAAAAHVNLSMVNYFFGSKKGLLKEILDSFLSKYLTIAEEELVGNADIHKKLEKFITRTVHYFDVERDSLIITISELPHDDLEIVEHKAKWARRMVELVNREICEPLAEESGNHIPSSCFAPMLTTIMASRFLFSPLLEKVDPKSLQSVDIDLYIRTIVRMLLHGITSPEHNCLSNT